MATQSTGGGRYHVVLDVVDRGTATGFVTDRRDSRRDIPASAYRSDGKWHVYGGSQDEHHGEHRQLHHAVRKMVASMGETSGSATIGNELKNTEQKHIW